MDVRSQLSSGVRPQQTTMFGRVLAGTFCVTAAALLCSACRGDDPEETIRKRRTARITSESAELRQLPRCALPPVGDLAGWVRVADGRLALPPGFQPETVSVDSSGRPAPGRYMHGGFKWTDGPREVELIGGHYGIESFAGPGPRHGLPDGWCRTELSGRLSVFILPMHPDSAGRFRASAWVPARPSEGSLRPSYSVEGPWTDREVLLRILTTVRPEHVLDEK